jgi:hypothetical protein
MEASLFPTRKSPRRSRSGTKERVTASWGPVVMGEKGLEDRPLEGEALGAGKFGQK